MSKIEVTEEQAAKLEAAWISVGFPATRAKAYTTVANELVAMGLVRPASDDLAARVAALEAKYETLSAATLGFLSGSMGQS